MLSRFSRVQLCATHRRQPTRLPCPWDPPGKNTGVGCHFLQCMKVKSESEVTQSCPTLSDPMDCSLPGSSIPGIFQARVLEWGAIAFSIDAMTPHQSHFLPGCSHTGIASGNEEKTYVSKSTSYAVHFSPIVLNPESIHLGSVEQDIAFIFFQPSCTVLFQEVKIC